VPSPREHSTRGPRILSRARTGAPSSRRAGKEPVPEYNSDSDTAPVALQTPTLCPSSTRTPITSSTSGRTLRSLSPRKTPLNFPCQGRPLGWL
jgi:cell division septation protein DedD